MVSGEVVDARPERWLRDVVERATRNVADGGGPFAAMVVQGAEVVATGVNRVTRDLDPTAHAEVVAIRAAARDDAAHGGFDDRAFYELFDRPRDTWPLVVRQVDVDGAVAPFAAWLAKADRVEY